MLAVAHVLGLMMAFFGLLYLLPIGWSLAVQDGAVIDFVAAALINAFVGLAVATASPTNALMRPAAMKSMTAPSCTPSDQAMGNR